MKKEETYKCEGCGKTVKASGKKTPECCGEAMQKVTSNICLQSDHAEDSRPMDDEEPCDDGRAGE
jgi:hypothetical protein